MSRRLIVFKELKPKKGVGYCRDHLRRKCDAGEFPPPIQLSDHRIAWFEDEVDQWLEDLAAARDAREATKVRAGRPTQDAVIQDTVELAAAAPRADDR